MLACRVFCTFAGDITGNPSETYISAVHRRMQEDTPEDPYGNDDYDNERHRDNYH